MIDWLLLILVWFHSIGFCLADYWLRKMIPIQWKTGCQLMTPSRNEPPPSASTIRFSNHWTTPTTPKLLHSVYCQSVCQSVLFESIKIVFNQFSVQFNQKLLTFFAFFLFCFNYILRFLYQFTQLSFFFPFFIISLFTQIIYLITFLFRISI